MAQVILIGSTMGNLACAARLSVKGHSVAILEATDSWAPDLIQERHGEFVFDVRHNFLTLPAVYRDLFLKTGDQLEDHVELVEDHITTRFDFPDGTTLRLPGAGIGASASAISETFGQSAGNEWKTFMSHAGQMWALTRQPLIESTPPSLANLLRSPRGLSLLRKLSAHLSYAAYANKHFTDSRISTLAQHFASRVGSDPCRAPAMLATIPYLESTFGIQHINGGMRRLADALYERCLSLGVTFHFKTAVTSVTKNQSTFHVDTNTGRHLLGEYLVVDSDAFDWSTMSELGEAPATKKTKPSHSEFVLLLALRGKTPGIEHHNVWFGQSSHQEFDTLNSPATPISTDPNIYACVPNDNAMHPSDDEAWCIRVRASLHDPINGTDWGNSDIIAQATETVLTSLAVRGLDLRSRILWSNVHTPAHFGRDSSNHTGSLWGLTHNGRLSFLKRWANASAISGLYILGRSAHPGPSLPFVAIGANIVAQDIGK